LQKKGQDQRAKFLAPKGLERGRKKKGTDCKKGEWWGSRNVNTEPHAAKRTKGGRKKKKEKKKL